MPEKDGAEIILEDDGFEEAFNEFSLEKPLEEKPPEEKPPEEKPPEEKPPEEKPPVEKPPEEKPPVEKLPVIDDGWAKKEKEYQDKLSAIQAENEELKKVKPAKTSVDFMSNLTEEEKRDFEEYEKEFGEISKFEAIKRKAEIKAAVEEATTEFKQEISRISGILEEVNGFASDYGKEKHLSLIRSKHSDFDDLVDSGKVEDWIKTQPSEVKNVYQKWYDEGTAKQVISLFDLYKEQNKPPPDPLEKEKGKKKEEKKENLEAVITKKTPVNSSMTAKDDFEGAFEEFSKE